LQKGKVSFGTAMHSTMQTAMARVLMLLALSLITFDLMMWHNPLDSPTCKKEAVPPHASVGGRGQQGSLGTTSYIASLHKMLQRSFASARQRYQNNFDKFYSEMQECTSSVLTKDFLVVQLGAHVGVEAGDSVHRLALRDHWKGVLVEPVPFLFDKLVHNYKAQNASSELRFANVAVGTENSIQPFFYINTTEPDGTNDLPNFASQIGSFNREHLLKHGGWALKYIAETPLQVVTLDTLLERYLGTRDLLIHYLHIDLEGHDWKVLRSIDIDHYQPLFIAYEHFHLSEDDKKAAMEWLGSKGYLVKPVSMDTWAIRCNNIVT